MSLLWKTATEHDDTPWSHEEGEIHDGVEEYGNIPVAHPDDTPWHDDDLMDTARREHGHFDVHRNDYQGIQAWLEKDTLDHLVQHPHQIHDKNEPIRVIHDEDTGEHFLADGHHRAVVTRHLGLPGHLPAVIEHVSRDRL